MRSLIAAFRFLTRLPVPGRPTTAEELPGALAWFPLVGALCGAAVAGVFVLAVPYWPTPVAAVLAVAFGLILTGGFHEDAASDAADGLGGGHDNESVLRIMRDSRIGAFGAMSLWVVLSARVAFLIALDGLSPQLAIAAYALACAWGRWTAAPLIRLLPPLSDGLAKDIGPRLGWTPLVVATLGVAGATYAAWRLGLPHALPAAAAALTATALWALYLRRRLGGQSGDLLGAGNQLVEAAVLLVLIARF